VAEHKETIIIRIAVITKLSVKSIIKNPLIGNNRHVCIVSAHPRRWPNFWHKIGIEYLSINGAHIGFKQYGKVVRNIAPIILVEYLACDN